MPDIRIYSLMLAAFASNSFGDGFRQKFKVIYPLSNPFEDIYCSAAYLNSRILHAGCRCLMKKRHFTPFIPGMTTSLITGAGQEDSIVVKRLVLYNAVAS